jgi:hypothetical protein
MITIEKRVSITIGDDDYEVLKTICGLAEINLRVNKVARDGTNAESVGLSKEEVIEAWDLITKIYEE